MRSDRYPIKELHLHFNERRVGFDPHRAISLSCSSQRNPPMSMDAKRRVRGVYRGFRTTGMPVASRGQQFKSARGAYFDGHAVEGYCGGVYGFPGHIITQSVTAAKRTFSFRFQKPGFHHHWRGLLVSPLNGSHRAQSA